MSPCISVCALMADGLCSGCLRTRDEIANWMRMTAAEQWALMRELEERRMSPSKGAENRPRS
jgi:uncharacterized protein